MLHESAHLRITADRGVATLWLGFPGEPVNALDVARLRELDSAIGALENDPYIDRVVVRSAKPAGFSAGVHPAALASLAHPSDRAAFAAFGQRVFARLSSLRAITIAFIEGPCLGAGLELALACDYRLSVASLTNHIGFPAERPCCGGTVRLPKRLAKSLIESGRTLSGREAQAMGIVDRAFCERRAKIELQTFLNEREKHPREPRRVELSGFAEERRAFADSPGREPTATAPLEPAIALARRFITPLEFDQMTKDERVVQRETVSVLKRAA